MSNRASIADVWRVVASSPHRSSKGRGGRPVARARQRGAGAILAMMFLVIFASLGTAMAIVAQGNLRTADSHLRMNRALAAAETGMRFTMYRMQQVIAAEADLVISEGVVDTDLAEELWETLRAGLYDSFDNELHNEEDPWVFGDTGLHIGPIAIGPEAPKFTAAFIQHPIPSDLPADHPFHGHSYDSRFYQRMPYAAAVTSQEQAMKQQTGVDWVVSSSAPLDARWVRLRVTAKDGDVARSISMDLRIDKRLDAAVLSKSRVMIGRNVMIEGRIGSTFMDVDLPNGHPVQMEDDFRGLNSDLDDLLDAFVGALAGDPSQNIAPADADGDNRLNSSELAAVDGQLNVTDVDGDGYVDAYDLFLAEFQNSEGSVQLTDLESGGVSNVRAKELLQLIDTFGDPGRPGYGDGKIDHQDRYAKVRGEVIIAAAREDWQDGAAKQPYGTYQDYFQGPIQPGHHKAPLEFEAEEDRFPQFDQHDFQAAAERLLLEHVTSDVWTVAENNPERRNSDKPQIYKPAGTGQYEEVPYGAEHPYDHYDRPVFENMVFTNVRIPAGTNALFVDCVFTGVTYVEVAANNSRDQYPHPTDPEQNAFNYGGMQEADGSPMYPEVDDALKDYLPSGKLSPKDLGNNLRFHNCRFEGSIVSGDQNGGQPLDFSHTRNKLNFTGETEFPDVMDQAEVPGLSAAERQEFRRSRILAPHMSVEMGTFNDPTGDEAIHLTGAIVAGIIDMRGNIKIDGTLMTTYEPKAGDGTVMGDTSPNFNTTLGYFSNEAGDLEAGALPGDGMGVIQIRYDPSLPLPDGVMARIRVDPMVMTYFEGGAN